MWTGKGRAGVCSPSWFSSCTETDSGGGENPNSAPGLELWLPPGGRQPPPRARAPSPASPRPWCLKKNQKNSFVPLQSHALPPTPALQQRFWTPPGIFSPHLGPNGQESSEAQQGSAGDGVGGAGGTRGLFPPKSPPRVFLLRARAKGSDGSWVGFGPVCLFPPQISCTRGRWRHRSPQPRAGRCPRDPSPP